MWVVGESPPSAVGLNDASWLTATLRLHWWSCHSIMLTGQATTAAARRLSWGLALAWCCNSSLLLPPLLLGRTSKSFAEISLSKDQLMGSMFKWRSGYSPWFGTLLFSLLFYKELGKGTYWWLLIPLCGLWFPCIPDELELWKDTPFCHFRNINDDFSPSWVREAGL